MPGLYVGKVPMFKSRPSLFYTAADFPLLISLPIQTPALFFRLKSRPNFSWQPYLFESPRCPSLKMAAAQPCVFVCRLVVSCDVLHFGIGSPRFAPPPPLVYKQAPRL